MNEKRGMYSSVHYVRPSIPFARCVETAGRMINLFTSYNSPIILVSHTEHLGEILIKSCSTHALNTGRL